MKSSSLKNTLICLFGLLVLPTVPGCSDYLKGKPKKDEVVEIKQERSSCLKNVVLDFEKFLDGNLATEEVDKSFDCIKATLKDFQSRVEGKSDPNSFTIDELLEIITKFAPDAHVSKEGIKSILVLKAAFIGGDSQRITKSEIDKIQELVLVLRAESKKMLPYAPLLRLKKTVGVYKKEFLSAAFTQLNSSLKTIVTISKFSDSKYDWENIKKLTLSLNFLNEDQKELLPLVDKVYAVIVGEAEVKGEKDHMLLIDNLTELLRIYSMQISGLVKFQKLETDFINNNIDFIQDLVQLLENSIQFKKTGTISVKTIDGLMVEAHKRDLFPLKLSLETAMKFYKTLTVRALEGGPEANVNEFTGFKKLHFLNFNREIAVYKLYSRMIENVFKAEVSNPSSDRIKVSILQQKIKSYDIRTETDVLRNFDSENQRVLINIIEELKTEFLQKRPTFYRNDRIIFARNYAEWDQSWHDLARGFYTKMMARELVLGWGTTHFTKEVKNSFITESGIALWYQDFRGFGIELKLFDPRSVNGGVRSFKEANLFTQFGNGDDKMTFPETIEYLGILSSGGGVAYKDVERGLAAGGCNLPEKDVFLKPWNSEDCAVQNLVKNYNQYFSHLPHLVNYLDTISLVERSNFFKMGLDVARVKDNSGFVGFKSESGEIRAAVVILHYIESLYMTFDSDFNGQLSYEEIKTSFPRFKLFAYDFAKKKSQGSIDIFNNYLSKVGWGCYSEEELIRDSFAFLVFNGRTPKATDFYLVPCPRTKPLLEFKGEIDRKTIFNTFKILKAAISS